MHFAVPGLKSNEPFLSLVCVALRRQRGHTIVMLCGWTEGDLQGEGVGLCLFQVRRMPA